MNTFGLLAFGFFAYVFQSTLMRELMNLIAYFSGLSFLSGRTVDLAFIVLIYVAFHRRIGAVVAWAIVLGMMSRPFGYHWTMVQECSFLIVAIGAALVQRHVILKGYATVFFGIFVLSAVEGFLHLFLGQMWMRTSISFVGMIPLIIVQSLVNGIFGPVIHMLLSQFDEWTGETSHSKQGSLVLLDM